MPLIIGITGPKRSGKNTVANMVERIYDEVTEDLASNEDIVDLSRHANVWKLAFAEPIKQICKDVFGWTDDQLETNLKDVPDTRYPRSQATQEVHFLERDLLGLVDFWISSDDLRSQMKADIKKVLETNKRALQPMGPVCLTPRFAMQHLGTEWGRWMYEHTWVKLTLRKARQASADDIVCITDVRFLNEAAAIKEDGGVIWRVERDEVDTTDPHPSEQEMAQIEADNTLPNNGTLEELEEKVRTCLRQAILDRVNGMQMDLADIVDDLGLTAVELPMMSKLSEATGQIVDPSPEEIMTAAVMATREPHVDDKGLELEDKLIPPGFPGSRS